MDNPSLLFFATSKIADGNMSFRVGDVSQALENRQALLEKHGLQYESCIAMQCDHGDTILIVEETNAEKGAKTQAEMPVAEVLLTDSSAVSLMLLTADCVPAVLYDPKHHAVALAHLNRKTIAHHLAARVVETMTATYNTEPAELLVWFEPHIHATNYRFTLPLTESLLPELAAYCTEKDGQVNIDFAAAHFDELTNCGIPNTNITVSEIDVYQDENYFSHVASKTGLKPAGRHATVVALHPVS